MQFPGAMRGTGTRVLDADPVNRRFAATSHAGGGTRTPDTRIMIPLRFGSAAGFAGAGGHERGHVCNAVLRRQCFRLQANADVALASRSGPARHRPRIRRLRGVACRRHHRQRFERFRGIGFDRVRDRFTGVWLCLLPLCAVAVLELHDTEPGCSLGVCVVWYCASGERPLRGRRRANSDGFCFEACCCDSGRRSRPALRGLVPTGGELTLFEAVGWARA